MSKQNQNDEPDMRIPTLPSHYFKLQEQVNQYQAVASALADAIEIHNDAIVKLRAKKREADAKWQAAIQESQKLFTP